MHLKFLTRSTSPVRPRTADGIETVPPAVRRNTFLIALGLALQSPSVQMAITLSALMVTKIIGSIRLAGLGGTLLALTQVLVSYPIGKLNDTYGRKFGMIASAVLGLGGGLLLGVSLFADSFAIYIVGIVVLGVGMGAGRQIRVAAADMYPPARRGEGLGFVLTGTVAGAFIAPVVVSGGEWLSTNIDVDPIAVSWFILPISLVPALACFLLVRPDPKQIAMEISTYWPGHSQEARPPGTSVGLLSFLAQRPKQVAYLCFASAQSSMSMMMIMTPLVLSDSGYSLRAIALAVALHVVGMFAFSIFFGRAADRVGRKPMLILGLFIAAGGAALVPVTPVYAIITFGLFLVGVGWSSINVAATAILADTTAPDERGRAIGANDTLGNGFSMSVPLLAGIIADVFGLTGVGIAGAALALLPFLLIGRLHETSPGRYADRESAATVK